MTAPSPGTNPPPALLPGPDDLPDLPGTRVHPIDNSGPLDHAVQAVLSLLPAPTDKSFP